MEEFETSLPKENTELPEENSGLSGETAGLSEEQAGSREESDEKVLAAIEAILFTMGESVEISAISKALDISAARIRKLITKLKKRYDAPSRGIMIQQFDDAVQMSTKPEQYENLIRIAKVPKKMTLSDSVMETLSIIAYKQPITKVEVEGIRGAKQNRPAWCILSSKFLRSFGVKNLTELPSINTVQVEEFKEEAEAEVDDRLGI